MLPILYKERNYDYVVIFSKDLIELIIYDVIYLRFGNKNLKLNYFLNYRLVIFVK